MIEVFWVGLVSSALLTFCAIFGVLMYRAGYRKGVRWTLSEWKKINEMGNEE